MKFQLLFLIIVLMAISLFASNTEDTKKSGNIENLISVSSTPELYPLTLQLANEFNASEIGVNVAVEAIHLTNSELLLSDFKFSFLTDHDIIGRESEDNWKMVVGRDVIVPIMNSNNPFYAQLMKQGVTSIKLSQIFSKQNNSNWGYLLDELTPNPIKLYIHNDEIVNTSIEQYLNVKNIQNLEIENVNELVSKIRNDKYAIGFCHLSTIIDLDNSNFIKDICLLPIDINSNGKLEKIENIYTDPALFSRGVWIGKYPKTLYQNIYAVSAKAPTNNSELEFLKWIVSNGAQSLIANDYVGLTYNEIPSKLSKLNPVIVNPKMVEEPFFNIRTSLILLGLILVSIILIDRLLRVSKRNKTVLESELSNLTLAIDENSIIIPNGVYFDKTHTWAFMEKNGNVRVGIDDFLQHVTGALSRVILKDEGVVVKKCEPLLTLIQAGKQIDICAPISGRIKAFNSEIITDSSKLNTSPYDKGWLYMIEPSNWEREIEFLSMSGKYKTWIKSEFDRLKNFLTNVIAAEENNSAQIVLQDGGEVVDNVLSQFGPKVWDDFQSNFIDNA